MTLRAGEGEGRKALLVSSSDKGSSDSSLEEEEGGEGGQGKEGLGEP